MTSSGASDAPDGTTLASQIRANGWWQGAIVAADTLRQVDETLDQTDHGGVTHWILASQTCNLYNTDFEKIPKVEWIGATKLPSTTTKSPDSRMENGKNPRVLYCRTVSSPDDVAWYSCDIQVRHWGPRVALATKAPESKLIDDASGHWPDQQKDIFIRWIARSYTRLELSDALGQAFKDSQVSKIIDKIVTAYKDDIFGIFLDLDPDGEASAAEALPPEEVVPPCIIEFFFVVTQNQAAVQEAVTKALAEKTNPKDATSPSFRDLMKACGMTVSFSVRDSTTWTIQDVLGTVRYTFPDYFSGTDATGGE